MYIHIYITQVLGLYMELYPYNVELYIYIQLKLYTYNSSYIHVTLLILQYLGTKNSQFLIHKL